MTYKVVLLSFSEKTEWGPLCLHANVKVGILEQWIPNCFSIVIMIVRIMQIEKLNTTSHCVNIKKKNCRDIKSPVWYAMLAKM